MKTLLTLTLVLFLTPSFAQVFPVQVSLQITPPYSPYLSDYTAPGSQSFAIHIYTNDITLADYRARLRLTIEGPGITLRTQAAFVPRPLHLQGGVPQTFYGEDLQEYFHPDNLTVSGLPFNEYAKNRRLPDGIYRFSIEVLDYNRGTVVSNKGTAMAWVILNDPPILILPSNFSKLKIQDPLNILFSWTPRHTGSPNAAFSTEYIFRLVELWPEQRHPNDAFLTTPPLYETTTTENQLHFGPNEPRLLPGRKYAWQVQAHVSQGKDLFKNKGYSEVFVFQYGEALAVPANLRMRWAKPTTLAIKWDPLKDSDPQLRYRLQYRPRLRRENHEWYETWTRFTDKTLYNLQTNTEYEMRIRSENALQDSEYSGIQVFTTLREEQATFACRDNAPPPPVPASTLPVFPLSVNDTIHAGGYDVLVRDVMRAGTKYFGSGLAIVPWFNGAKVRVTFENIGVNDRFWLTSGAIKSVWNRESSSLWEEQTPVTAGSVPETGNLDITVVESDSLVSMGEAIIASVTKDETGNIIVTTTAGETVTLARGESYALADGAGNGYVIDEKGNIAKTTSTAETETATRGNRNYRIALQFVPEGSEFGFDEKRFDGLESYYQRLEDGTHVPWKALSTSRPDLLGVTVRSGDIDIGRVTFEAGAAPVIATVAPTSSATLSLQGKVAGIEEELLASYRISDTIPPIVVGKVNLATYDPIYYNLEIVPVNGATLPGGIDGQSIARELNSIYRKAVVAWNVSVTAPLQVPLGRTFDPGDTGLLSNYSQDMKSVLRAYGSLRDNTYYLFVIEEPSNPSLLGYMPRGRQAGFVFVRPHQGNGREFLKTIAHELGHGAFNLQHTFREHSLPAGSTDNVMDYSDGTALYKYQWDYIHKPRMVVGLFEGGEEVESVYKGRIAFYQQATAILNQPAYQEWIEEFKKVVEFFQVCNDEGWESYQGKGIIPHCFWRDSKVSAEEYYTNQDIPFTAGLIDGGYLELESLYSLPEIVRSISKSPGKIIYAYTLAYWECQTDKLTASYEDYEYVIGKLAGTESQPGIWNWVSEQWRDYKEEKVEIEQYFQDCRDADDLRETIDDLYELTANWEEIKTLSKEVCNNLATYWEILETADNDGRYQRGALIVPAASIILPLGVGVVSKAEKLKKVLLVLGEESKENLQKIGARISQALTFKSANKLSLSPPLLKIYDDCIRAGYKASDEGLEIVFRRHDNVVIAKISKNRLHIKIPYDNGWAAQSDTEAAHNVLENIANSRKVYRLGGLSRSTAAEGQFWSPENPFEFPSIWDFAKKYGIVEDNLKGDVFFEIGLISENVPYITREAPAFGNNLGGGIEVVVPVNTIKLENFSTVNFDRK